ncbi:MAG: transposase [Pseudomonadota bacterium]|nr:transposase [Pseudomonadota bacterium]
MSSLLSSGWSSVLSALPSSLDLTALARSEGAIKRNRRISDGETLLRLALWYGPCGLSLRSAAALAAGTDTANLSDVALLKRLSGAADWLETIVGKVLAQRQSDFVGGTRDLVLIDGTAISRPGGGGDWVLHSRYKPGHGFSGFALTDRSGGETLERHVFKPGEIVIADRAYARGGKGLSHVLEQGADFIVRAGWRSMALRGERGQRFDLLARLKDLRPGEMADLQVNVASGADMLPIRLVVQARDDEAVQAAVQRVCRKAQKNGRASDPRSQEAARYMIIATSLDPESHPAASVLALYKMRWQIEIAFKRLKSLLNIDRLPAKSPNLARAWLNAHLLLALLIDDITQQLLDSPPCAPD